MIKSYHYLLNQAQDIHIQNYLGTELYVKIQNEIVAGTLANPYLALLNDYIK